MRDGQPTRWERVRANLRAAREELRAHRRGCHFCGSGYATHNPTDFPCMELAHLTAKVRRRQDAVELAKRERRVS